MSSVPGGNATLDACLIKSTTLNGVLVELFPNLQLLTEQERSEALRNIVNKFPQKTVSTASESLGREDQQLNPRSTANEDSYDGNEPLAHPGHEATAQYMSHLRQDRELKTATELANSLGVTRQTIHRWMKEPGVLRRAYHLTAIRKWQGDVIGRLAWARIMRGQAKKAEHDTTAAKFVAEQVWPKEKQLGTNGRTKEETMSVGEMMFQTFSGMNEVVPTGMLDETD
jgi:hypothetical protein